MIGFKKSVGNLIEDLVVEGKTPFVSYKSDKNSEIKVVKNLVQPENLQSDNRGRVLDINQQKFVGETGPDGTKNINSFKIVDGGWTKKS